MLNTKHYPSHLPKQMRGYLRTLLRCSQWFPLISIMNTRRPINYGHKFFAKLQKKSRMAKYCFCFCEEIVMMSYQFLIAWISHSKGLVKTMQKHSGDNSKSEHFFPIVVFSVKERLFYYPGQTSYNIRQQED